VEDLQLTPPERAQILDACTWVGVTASFLPYLRRYLTVRLADRPDLSAKVARLDDRGAYHLWEWIKDEQLRPVLCGLRVENPDQFSIFSKSTTTPSDQPDAQTKLL
jgi:hypothetical protein